MTKVEQQTTTQYQWYQLINDAETKCLNTYIDDEVKAYLLHMLQRFMHDRRLGETIIAIEYLKGCQSQGMEQKIMLRNVGDKCLLFCGMFPERVKKRNVSVLYYKDMGLTAYGTLSELHDKEPNTKHLYSQLHQQFNSLKRILECITAMHYQSMLADG